MPAAPAPGPDLVVQAGDPSRWRLLLASVGLRVSAAPAGFRLAIGGSDAAREAGFWPTEETVRVAAVVETRAPRMELYWEEPLELPVYEVPPEARVFVREKHTGAPLLAGLPSGRGALLWAITGPGPRGYDRFPYLIQALVDLGLEPPFRGTFDVFVDFAYRTRADPVYLARRWREAGVRAVHLSAWPFHDPDAKNDRRLRTLIEACRREGILVFAWLELPHVSEGFWDRHPPCREKTAIGQDAQLDWRKLVNLADPGCFELVAEGLRELLGRFEWDGVNLAEVYFESLHGPGNPQRFTPMNGWVRRDFQNLAGWDPIELFKRGSPRFWKENPEAWQRFADYRAGLALETQRKLLEALREAVPGLALAVTQIDDQFDPSMRELLGVDMKALAGLAAELDFRLIIEDPAPLWSLGPERYEKIARRYRALAPPGARLGIDLNIVERYQHTYPSKKQIGGELFRLLHAASGGFSRVLLYFEHSISRPDWPLLAAAAAPPAQARRENGALVVECERPVGLRWQGPAEVNGRLWPAGDGGTLWLPAGRHRVRASAAPPPVRLTRLAASLIDARAREGGVEFEYESDSRTWALLDREPASIRIDGAAAEPRVLQTPSHWAVRLPPGRRRVTIHSSALLR